MADLGVVGLTGSEEDQLEDFAASSLRLDLFETKSSIDDLERFGEQAQAALHAVDEDFFGGSPRPR